jgi:translation initiation factor 1A
MQQTLIKRCGSAQLLNVQDEKADVILKYMADEARNLKQYGELPENIRVNDADVFEEYEGADDDDIIEFTGVDDI